MPVMDGNAATAAIRALPRKDAKAVPIIAMTANAYEEDAELSRASGMDAHLSKPVDPQTLYKTLAHCLADDFRSHGAAKAAPAEGDARISKPDSDKP
jgi:CheY-like chemotaxis protein